MSSELWRAFQEGIIAMKWLQIDQNLRKKCLPQKVDFNCLSFDLIGSKSFPYEGLKFEYSVKMHYHFIAGCILILQVAASMLSFTR